LEELGGVAFFALLLLQTQEKVDKVNKGHPSSVEILGNVGPVAKSEDPAHQGELHGDFNAVGGRDLDGDGGDSVVPPVNKDTHVPALLAQDIQLGRTGERVDHARVSVGGNADLGPKDGEEFVPVEGEVRAHLPLLAPLWRMAPWIASLAMTPTMRKEAALPRGLGRALEEALLALLSSP